MEIISYEKDYVIIPFIISKSEGNKVIIDENQDLVLGLPENSVLELIQNMKDIIEEIGYINLGDKEIFMTHISTESNGWPISANIVGDEYFRKNLKNPFIGFEIIYSQDTNELIKITEIFIDSLENIKI